MNSRSRLIFILFGILAGVSGCTLGPQFGPPPPPGPTPVITSISPTSATAGGAAFTLTVNGSHFLSGADLVWRNPDNPGFSGGEVTLVSSSQVTLQVPSAVIAIPGSAQILVFNPDSSPQSNTVSFVINPGPPGGAQVISQGANDATPNGNSHDPVLSFNGRFVAFASEATNLIVPNAKFPQGYVRDTCLGALSAPPCNPLTLLVSAITGGTAANPWRATPWEARLHPSTIRDSHPFPAVSLPRVHSLVSCPRQPISLLRIRRLSRLLSGPTACPPFRAPGCTPTTVLASVTQGGAEPNGATSAFIFANNSCYAVFLSAGTDVVSGVTTPNEYI